jgi:hypothetical protein
LREIICAIDSAVDGGEALEKAKGDREFATFAEEALSALERASR